MTSFFQKLKTGLEEAVAHDEGKITLKSKLVEVPEAPQEYTSKQIKKIREDILKCSQPIFAMILGVSVKTIQAWESGERKPSPTALRLLELIKNRTFRPILEIEEEIA